MAEPTDPIAVAIRVSYVLDALGILHTVGGSIVAALAADFYVDEDAVRRAVRTRASVNVIDSATMLKVDLFVAGGTSATIHRVGGVNGRRGEAPRQPSATQATRRRHDVQPYNRRLPPAWLSFFSLSWNRMGEMVAGAFQLRTGIWGFHKGPERCRRQEAWF